MYGIPKVFNTQADYEHTHLYVKTAGDKREKKAFKRVLEGLLASEYRRVLKESALGKPAGELTDDDYKNITDPQSAFSLSGLTKTKINNMIKEL